MGHETDQSDSEIYHVNIKRDEHREPAGALVDKVAQLKGVEQDQLNPLYKWADHLIEDLYSSPPPAHAQGVVEFSYEGYRVTVYQDGHAILMDRSTSK